MSVTNERQDQTDVERLLALAGPRDAVPAERLERMRGAVHDAWKGSVPELQGQTPSRRTRVFGWTLAAAATAAIVVMIALMWKQVPAREQVRGGRQSVYMPEIATAHGELRSIRLRSGAEIRIDASSRVLMTDDQSQLHLMAGAVYIDSRGAVNMPMVRTPGGDITDIGTRFEVRVIDAAGTTRVRVRDGRVRMEQTRAIVVEAGAAEELVSHPEHGGIDRRHVDPFGADWAWVTRAAPLFDLEGKSLGNFLDWIEKEGAWTVVFAPPALERRARPTVLHGSVEHMSTTEALEMILLACGLSPQVDVKTGRVTVVAEGRQ